MNGLASICHRCEHAQASCSGRCACLYDPAKPVDILVRVETRHCPEGRFRLGLGDTIARLLHAAGIAKPAKALLERATGKPCGCAERQAKLNSM